MDMSDIPVQFSEMDDIHLTVDDQQELHDQVFSHLSPTLTMVPAYENWCQTVRYKEGIIQLDVHDTKTLCEMMKRLNELNQERIKAKKNRIILRVAAGCLAKTRDRISTFSKSLADIRYQDSFSVSPCVEAHIIIHLVGEEFDKIIIDHNLVTVGPNVQIGQLEAKLYQNKPSLSLPVSPLIPWVTLVGIAANAGHGTGLNQPAIAGLIERITMIKANGELKTITKADGDFDVINGAHLGLFGIVTEVTIKCIPACKLKKTTNSWSLNEFFRQVKEENLYENNEYVSVMYIPTYYDLKQEKEFINVHVVVAKQVSIEMKDVYWDEKQQAKEDKEQHFQLDVFNFIRFPDYLRAIPNAIPCATRLIAAIKVGIFNHSPAESTGPFYQLSHYQRQFPRELDDIDFLFPVKQPKDMLIPLDKIITTLDKYCAQGHYPVSDAIYIRMFKGTNGGLSTSSHQPDEYTAAIDIVTDPYTSYYQLSSEERRRGLHNKFKEEIQDYFMDPSNKLRAKPHWGKALPKKVDYALLYGDDFKQFMRAAENWYKDVGCTFDTSPFMNPFFERIFNIEVSQPMGKVQSMRPMMATSEAHIVTDDKLIQLENHVNEIKKKLAERHYIYSPETPQFGSVAGIGNSEDDENDCPYIGLYCRPKDQNAYCKQQKEIQTRANEYLQKVDKGVAAAKEKNKTLKIALNSQNI